MYKNAILKNWSKSIIESFANESNSKLFEIEDELKLSFYILVPEERLFCINHELQYIDETMLELKNLPLFFELRTKVFLLLNKEKEANYYLRNLEFLLQKSTIKKQITIHNLQEIEDIRKKISNLKKLFIKKKIGLNKNFQEHSLLTHWLNSDEESTKKEFMIRITMKLRDCTRDSALKIFNEIAYSEEEHE